MEGIEGLWRTVENCEIMESGGWKWRMAGAVDDDVKMWRNI